MHSSSLLIEGKQCQLCDFIEVRKKEDNSLTFSHIQKSWTTVLKALKEQLIDNYLDICMEKLNTIAYECVFC